MEKEFVFAGQIQDFKESLEASNDLEYEILPDNKIVFRPQISVGTMQVRFLGLSFYRVGGIKVKAQISKMDSRFLRITLRTDSMIEHYFQMLVFITLEVALLAGGQHKAFFIVLGIWILSHAFLQCVYRFQENRLVRRIVSKFKLIDSVNYHV
jgi:hypothetical protein